MIVFPNAKINLGLNIVEKRKDGYHNVETLFYPIALCDILEIIPGEAQDLSFSQSGIGLPAKAGENLVEKAYQLLSGIYPMPKLKVHLHKVIPFGAGLGGGSSDASFALKAMDELAELGLSTDELKALSAKIGADCPFFVDNEPSLAKGIGDVLQSLAIDLSGYFLVLIKPNVVVPTAEAYKYVVPAKPKHPLEEIIHLPVEKWKGRLVNDFETSVFRSYPEIGAVKEKLYYYGAVYASMSGSGASVFGLFKNEVDLSSVFKDCFIFTQML